MSKFVSKGTALQLSIASVYTTVIQMITINAPDANVQTYDATALDTVGAGEEHLPTGYVDGGICSGTAFFDPTAATQKAMTALITTPALANWKIIWSNLTEWPFSGTLTKFTPKAERTTGLMFDWSIRLSGIVTYPT